MADNIIPGETFVLIIISSFINTSHFMIQNILITGRERLHARDQLVYWKFLIYISYIGRGGGGGGGVEVSSNCIF